MSPRKRKRASVKDSDASAGQVRRSGRLAGSAHRKGSSPEHGTEETEADDGNTIEVRCQCFFGPKARGDTHKEVSVVLAADYETLRNVVKEIRNGIRDEITDNFDVCEECVELFGITFKEARNKVVLQRSLLHKIDWEKAVDSPYFSAKYEKDTENVCLDEDCRYYSKAKAKKSNRTAKRTTFDTMFNDAENMTEGEMARIQGVIEGTGRESRRKPPAALERQRLAVSVSSSSSSSSSSASTDTSRGTVSTSTTTTSDPSPRTPQTLEDVETELQELYHTRTEITEEQSKLSLQMSQLTQVKCEIEAVIETLETQKRGLEKQSEVTGTKMEMFKGVLSKFRKTD